VYICRFVMCLAQNEIRISPWKAHIRLFLLGRARVFSIIFLTTRCDSKQNCRQLKKCHRKPLGNLSTLYFKKGPFIDSCIASVFVVFQEFVLWLYLTQCNVSFSHFNDKTYFLLRLVLFQKDINFLSKNHLKKQALHRSLF